jgi:hypothetical protein
MPAALPLQLDDQYVEYVMRSHLLSPPRASLRKAVTALKEHGPRHLTTAKHLYNALRRNKLCHAVSKQKKEQYIAVVLEALTNRVYNGPWTPLQQHGTAAVQPLVLPLPQFERPALIIADQTNRTNPFTPVKLPSLGAQTKVLLSPMPQSERAETVPPLQPEPLPVEEQQDEKKEADVLPVCPTETETVAQNGWRLLRAHLSCLSVCCAVCAQVSPEIPPPLVAEAVVPREEDVAPSDAQELLMDGVPRPAHDDIDVRLEEQAATDDKAKSEPQAVVADAVGVFVAEEKENEEKKEAEEKADDHVGSDPVAAIDEEHDEKGERVDAAGAASPPLARPLFNVNSGIDYGSDDEASDNLSDVDSEHADAAGELEDAQSDAEGSGDDDGDGDFPTSNDGSPPVTPEDDDADDEKDGELVDVAQFHLHACPICHEPVWHTPRH